MAAIVGALALVALTAGIVVASQGRDDAATRTQEGMPSGTPADGSAAADPPIVDDPGSGDVATTVDATTTTEGRTTTMDPAVLSESDALVQLREIVADDASVVNAELIDRWVPQVSSKRPNVSLSDGTTWNTISILEDHRQWRARFPHARLLWSGDYSTFEASDFWVTIVAEPFDTPEGALGWCDANALPLEDCYAKLISRTHPQEDSTRHR